MGEKKAHLKLSTIKIKKIKKINFLKIKNRIEVIFVKSWGKKKMLSEKHLLFSI